MYVTSVKVLLDELECLKEESINLARITNQSASVFLDKYSESMRDQVTSLEV